jgi:prepilin-type processing-associated H-X9-DG protein
VLFGGAPFTYGGLAFRLTDISDGTSTTLLAAEVLQGVSTPTINDVLGATWYGPPGGFETYYGPNTGSPDLVQFQSYCNDLPQQGLPCQLSAYNLYSARGKHAGGVNAMLCDGSVRFFSNNIAIQTWRALGTSQGGEVIDQSSY